ncbi:unnamed protein product [Ilex paraguariensis]|uniref:Uncharacterized protein n=1 Tax=Ilex paraguariensis TaxID=185542 RepID=A0ABC8U7J6_9AQUA
MVNLKSCASLINGSALCAIEQDLKAENVNVIAEISAELQRERQKNAELMKRISILEAQTQERDKDSLFSNRQGGCLIARRRGYKKFKRQKIEPNEKKGDGNIKLATLTKHDTQCLQLKDANVENHLVNWMSMDGVQFLDFEKIKDGAFAADCCDDEHDGYFHENDIGMDKDRENGENVRVTELVEERLPEDYDGKRLNLACLESSYGGQGEPKFSPVSQEMNKCLSKDGLSHDVNPVNNKMELKKLNGKETKMIGGCRESSKIFASGKDVGGFGSMITQKKLPKVAFCPKEVKRIIELKGLLLKNAQSHTIRKIIVFASLGIRHGCEDMHDLNFNHFSILRTGEPYLSPESPGEHVLYENPGLRRKVFYPNRQNPTLCPVQILEEEKSMRPSDASCPSCLFLCIKYGGQTRNLPQNEYVRQRMGRNKLNSFGPVICRMAMLVHIRSGSFFFKALGITLLFMASFPHDLVQRETKHRNLGLLQKYYRTDKDAEGEELFLPRPVNNDNHARSNSRHSTRKTSLSKSKGKKHTNSASRPTKSQKTILQSAPPCSEPYTQFGLLGYSSIQTPAMAAFRSMPSPSPRGSEPISNPVIPSTGSNTSYQNQSPYPMFQQHPVNSFMPMIFWHPPTAFPPSSYLSSYGYQSFPSAGNYLPIHPYPYNHPSCMPLVPRMVKVTGKVNAASEEADSSNSNSSSSSTKSKEQ